MIIFNSALFRMRNISDKIVEKIKTHSLCSITLYSEIRIIYKIMWKNTVDPDRPQMTI